MNLRKCVAFFSSFHLCACLALLTTSAAVDLLRRSPNLFSFVLIPVVKSSIALAGSIAGVAATSADHVGATVATRTTMRSSFVNADVDTFPRITCAAVSLRSLNAAATTVVTAAAAHRLASQSLLALAQASDKTATGETSVPSPGGEAFSTSFFGYLRNVEIPTFSAAVSSGVDRVASAVLLHFFPETRLPQQIPLSLGSLSWRKEASSSSRPPAAGGVAPAERAEAAADGVAVTGRSAARATAGDEKTQTLAPSAAPPAAPVAGVRVPVGDRCGSRISRSTCSWSPPGSADQECVSSSALEREFFPASVLHDSARASSLASPRCPRSLLSSSSAPPSSRAAAEGQRVCSDAARQQGKCSSSISEAVSGKLSTSHPTTPAGEKRAEFSSRLEAAARDGKPIRSVEVAAAHAAGEPSRILLHVTGEEAGGGKVANSVLLSPVPAAGAEDQPGTALPSAADTAREQRSGFAFPFAGGEVEFSQSFFEGLRNANYSPDSFSVDAADVRAFLFSLDFRDPLLLILIGFHLLLLASTLCSRRMHTVQLLLMSFVSVLLLCSKQLLLLCSLVEQRLRTDDSLASAVASFSSTLPSSSPSSSSSAPPQFYCCPSAAARATLFLLLFWWLPLFAALCLIVGTLLQELVASVLLLARRRAQATKRRLRSRDETAAAPAVSKISAVAASLGDNAAKT